jgi:hypothetical protein
MVCYHCNKNWIHLLLGDSKSRKVKSGKILVPVFEDLNDEKNEHTFSQQDSVGSCPYSK